VVRSLPEFAASDGTCRASPIHTRGIGLGVRGPPGGRPHSGTRPRPGVRMGHCPRHMGWRGLSPAPIRPRQVGMSGEMPRTISHSHNSCAFGKRREVREWDSVCAAGWALTQPPDMSRNLGHPANPSRISEGSPATNWNVARDPVDKLLRIVKWLGRFTSDLARSGERTVHRRKCFPCDLTYPIADGSGWCLPSAPPGPPPPPEPVPDSAAIFSVANSIAGRSARP
jgi:hypothetical protein